ncbi:MAG: lipopolysaccharide kinase InaA family protein [Nitrososphaerota archaeon]
MAVESGGVTVEDVVAIIEYPVKSGEELFAERLVLSETQRGGLEVSIGDGFKEISAPLSYMRRDISSSILGDSLSIRLLTPFKTIRGEEAVRQLQSQYLRRVVKLVTGSIIENYELAAIHVRLHPLYFLLRWLKPKLVLMPSLSRLFWWLGAEDRAEKELLSRVLARVREALDEAAGEEALLQKAGELYALNPSKILQSQVGERRPRLKLPFNPQIVRVISDPRLAVGALRLILSEVQPKQPITLAELDPDDWVFIQTSRGLQPISHDEPLIEAIKKHLSLEDVDVRVDRRGSILNSTYLLKIYAGGGLRESLFVKRYFSWTDVKWVAAKLWAMPLRNFYLSPGTRMSNEVFFLNYLAERGFSVPHIVYLSWGDKVLVENAINGFNLTELWTRERGRISESALEDITMSVGRMLAEVHGQGVVLGDCKPDNVMVSQPPQKPEIWLVDLEQASLRGVMSWDLSELILYMGRYLDPEEAERYASLITRGYLSRGRPEVVEGALDSKFQLAMLPWTPIWTQVWMLKSVERELRK